MWKIGQAVATIVLLIIAAIKKAGTRKELEREIDEESDKVIADFDATDGSQVRGDDPDLFR